MLWEGEAESEWERTTSNNSIECHISRRGCWKVSNRPTVGQIHNRSSIILFHFQGLAGRLGDTRAPVWGRLCMSVTYSSEHPPPHPRAVRRFRSPLLLLVGLGTPCGGRRSTDTHISYSTYTQQQIDADNGGKFDTTNRANLHTGLCARTFLLQSETLFVTKNAGVFSTEKNVIRFIQ